MRINMIYLAAGNSRRFLINGKQTNKLLQTIHGKPLFRYGLEQLQKAAGILGDCHIYVVTQYEEILEACGGEAGVTAVYSEESRKGISYSIRRALQCAGTEEEACYLFQAADQPFIRAETIVRFVREFLCSGKKAGSVMYGGIPGNPGIFCREYAEELKALTGDQGGRTVMKRHPEEIFVFPLDEEKERKDVDNFMDFQDICGQGEKKEPLKIYVAGSGGKTSLIHSLAGHYAGKGKRVLILTTTKMMVEDGMLFVGGEAEEAERMVRRAFEEQNIVTVGKRTDYIKKFTWIGEDIYKRIQEAAEVILIEADGSKRLPAKFPREGEPVIGEDADWIYVVFGLSALGQKMKDACHRYVLAADIAGAEDVIDEQTAATILRRGYMERLRTRYPDAGVYLVLNQADDDRLQKSAEQLAVLAGEDAEIISLKKESEKIANFIEKRQNCVI